MSTYFKRSMKHTAKFNLQFKRVRSFVPKAYSSTKVCLWCSVAKTKELVWRITRDNGRTTGVYPVVFNKGICGDGI